MTGSQKTLPSVYDAIVLGGGFYGVAIAIYLRQKRGLKNILIIEQEKSLMQRASYKNQARVHNGYHYPRSFTTAYRSRINLPKFLEHWPLATKSDFTKLYAIARRNSKVSAKQFERFCLQIGAKVELADPEHQRLFHKELIEQVYRVEEYAFNSAMLAARAREDLAQNNIQVQYNTEASDLSVKSDTTLEITLKLNGDTVTKGYARRIFNCTYSGLNQIVGDFKGTHAKLKQEITEMALLKLPTPLLNLGITVMDGPFFSIMPFPDRGLHTLSHVRFTPHSTWDDSPKINPYMRLEQYEKSTRVDRMLRDVSRYIPDIKTAQYADSLFEIKTILKKNEVDDGRPILFERDKNIPNFISVLGGKIDNIFDVFEKLDAEQI
ncbi:MAG: FAD-dependent oxidoreductase [Bdellovibrionaceae bacterium]|nr:FAD-dependent oxidoreductase [Pseudobdellovibrionaceae bacterium]